MNIQILVPIYNEGDNVTRLYKSIISEGIDFNSLVFLYDIDTDTSLPYIREMAASDKRITTLKNSFGRGVIGALKTGFANVEDGPVIVLMGDNSDKLSVVPEMVRLWERGATVVSPSRYMPGGKQHGGGLVKSTLSMVAGRVLFFFGFPTSDPTNNFKLYDGKWLRNVNIESDGGFEIALELCFKAYAAKQLVLQVPTEWFDRSSGESKFEFRKWIPKYFRWYLRCLGELSRQNNRV